MSIGAINAYILSLYDKGKEIEAGEAIEQFWKELAEEGPLYEQWSKGNIVTNGLVK